jgi:DNA-binding GntR family transcriptional regulator
MSGRFACGKLQQMDADPATADSGLARTIELQLRARIIAGELTPGAPLRQERLAQEFGASAIPVREALRRLERTGLVQFRPRRGAIVAELSVEDAREVAEMRAALEPLALAAAGPNQGPEHFDRARRAIALADNSDDANVWLASNRDFHSALYEPCRGPRLLATIQDLWLASDRHLTLVWRRLDYLGRSQDEHREILARCEARDIRGAVRALRTHIAEAGAALLRLLGERA